MGTAGQPELPDLFAPDSLARIACVEPICQEQILSQTLMRARAGLVDQWGRVHRVGERTVVGRRPGQGGVYVLESSISREHAELFFDHDQDAWFVRDLGSKNGTVLNDEPIHAPTRIRPGDAVFFGQVGFLFFLPSDGELVPLPDNPLASDTLRADQHVRLMHDAAAQSGFPPPDTRTADEDDDVTQVGLPRMHMRLIEPSGGGGGFLETVDMRIQLTTTQFTFLRVLAQRMEDEIDQPEPVRGFIRSSELLADLPWDTAHPEENHLKQLVRRVRRSLTRAGLGNLIESRRGFGYRLRVMPVTEESELPGLPKL